MRSPSPASRHGLAWIAVVGAVLGLLTAARGLIAVAYADRIYPGVQVLGVDLGGKTTDEATLTLQAVLEAYEHETLDVRVGDQELHLTPGELGFRPSALKLAQTAHSVGREGGLLAQLAGPVVASRLALDTSPDSTLLDAAAVESAISTIAAGTDRPAENAELAFTPQLTLSPSRTGQWLDQDGAREKIRLHLSTLSVGPLTLTVRTEQPRVSTERLEPVRERAAVLLGHSIVLTDGQKQWPIPTSIEQGSLALPTDPADLVDEPETYARFVRDVARLVDQPARDATLTFVSGKAEIGPEQPGRVVDQVATLAAFRARPLSDEASTTVVTMVVQPTVKASDLMPVADEAQALIDQGLVLRVDGQAYSVSATDVGDMLVVGPGASGQWGITLSSQRVEQLVARVNGQFSYPTQDARFGWENGRVKPLQQSGPAVVVDQPRAVAAILAGWRGGEVDLPIAAGALPIDAAYLDRLSGDLQGVIAERSISFAGTIPERAHNIALALSRINGTLVMPGETFSFDRAVGPTTLAAGYRWGFAYSTDQDGSKVVPAVAGGICQVSTTLFQSVFWAGYEIDERHWHTFAVEPYADHGYVGLDATVSPEDGLDFRFTNNSNHALLILGETRGDASYVALVGTKPDWTVKVDPEVITDVVPAPKEVERTESPLFARGRQILLERAQDGLTSHVVRHVISPDGQERVLRLASEYRPAPTSILVGAG